MLNTETTSLQDVTIAFSEGNITLVNICLSIIMFSVALSVKFDDLKVLVQTPYTVITGLISQYLVLPAVSFLLVWILKPEPGLALGMLLVAACPGGNISNFFSMRCGGNVALSVGLTIMATLLAPLMTPVNFEFWTTKLEYLEPLFNGIALNYTDLGITVLQILVIPLILGIWFNTRFPGLSLKITKPLQYLSVLILIAFIAVAFYGNGQIFIDHWYHFVFLVLAQNIVALLSGYLMARFTGRNTADQKTIAIETGVQNAGLALALVFTFFEPRGGLVLLVAWWGVWNIAAGLIVSQILRKWSLIRITSKA
ncbi:bile acid:sodium symporter family protein [Robertkochia sediminum]|uniref:bile acid:sodium symporter family protein n=1 Tax=Robertkochia sediminum TaxID=2785326 RepID=UPI001931D7F4|nr:bile acid:sodium symporter family protein [Robertkochia sediminum]MBL7471202.1 bile acid:sodium symporter family protein [Robertkochia sediminum]